MAMNRVQFQSGVSMTEFLDRHGICVDMADKSGNPTRPV
jgi:hypothetical protein